LRRQEQRQEFLPPPPGFPRSGFFLPESSHATFPEKVRYGPPIWKLGISGIMRFDTYLIEIDDRAAGILTRLGQNFSFHAVDQSLAEMNGFCFPDAIAAERAVRRRLRHGNSKRRA
jgi:hypothetical protein